MSEQTTEPTPAAPAAKTSPAVWFAIGGVALVVMFMFAAMIMDSNQRQQCALDNGQRALDTPIGEKIVKRDCM